MASERFLLAPSAMNLRILLGTEVLFCKFERFQLRKIDVL